MTALGVGLKDFEVVTMPHHGSADNHNDEFVRKIKSNHLVITGNFTGEGTGRPAQEVLEDLSAANTNGVRFKNVYINNHSKNVNAENKYEAAKGIIVTGEKTVEECSYDPGTVLVDLLA